LVAHICKAVRGVMVLAARIWQIPDQIPLAMTFTLRLRVGSIKWLILVKSVHIQLFWLERFWI
jgi:hypothetical protein